MSEVHKGDTIAVAPTSSETNRLANLVVAQTEYMQAAVQREEITWQAVEEAQRAHSIAAAKAERTTEQATETLEKLYDSFNNELEAAVHVQDSSEIVAIIDRYAAVMTKLVELSIAPTQSDFEQTMESVRALAEQLRRNARSLLQNVSLLEVVYIPLPSWGAEPLAAPVLATVNTEEGEVLLNLCDDPSTQQ